MTLIAIDFDQTLTADSGDPYKPGGETPNRAMVDYVRWLKEERNHDIVIWTARPWSHAQHVAGLCTQWGVQFNGLMCAKGGADAYIDDKAVNHINERDWKESVERLAAESD
jgi:nicotinamidase-related amidase